MPGIIVLAAPVVLAAAQCEIAFFHRGTDHHLGPLVIRAPAAAVPPRDVFRGGLAFDVAMPADRLCDWMRDRLAREQSETLRCREGSIEISVKDEEASLRAWPLPEAGATIARDLASFVAPGLGNADARRLDSFIEQVARALGSPKESEDCVFSAGLPGGETASMVAKGSRWKAAISDGALLVVDAPPAEFCGYAAAEFREFYARESAGPGRITLATGCGPFMEANATPDRIRQILGRFMKRWRRSMKPADVARLRAAMPAPSRDPK